MAHDFTSLKSAPHPQLGTAGWAVNFGVNGVNGVNEIHIWFTPFTPFTSKLTTRPVKFV